MPERRLPNSIATRVAAVKEAKARKAAVNEAEWPISQKTANDLDDITLKFTKELAEMDKALANKVNATSDEKELEDMVRTCIKHFIHVLNFGIKRGKYKVSDRSFYKLDNNTGRLPKLWKESELVTWGSYLIDGEKNRMGAATDNKPMLNPSIEELNLVFEPYLKSHTIQEDLKVKYSREHRDVIDILEEVDTVIRDIWDEVEFYYRRDTPEDMRREARAWGVVYAPNKGEKMPKDAIIIYGIAENNEKSIVMDGGFDAKTGFMITNTSNSRLQFYTTEDPSSDVPNQPIIIAPGETKDCFALELGEADNKHLMVYNPTSETATYSLYLINQLGEAITKELVMSN